jgi:multiple sugar transport system permease protein
MKQKNRADIVRTIVLAVLGIVVIIPLFMLVVSSLKGTRQEIMTDMGSWRAFWVTDPTFNNFIHILGPESLTPFGRYFLNSIIIMAATIGATLVVATMAGYALLRGKFRFNSILLLAITALYIIPVEAIMLPMLYEVIGIGITDTYIVQIVPFIANPLYIFLLYQFFRQVPESIAEAALLEGADFFRIFRSIYVPLNVPALATVAILQGLDMWNQYLWPLLVTQTDRVKPISVAIASFFGEDTIYWNYAMAASVLMIAPVVVFFLAFQRFFIRSVASSAVKG